MTLAYHYYFLYIIILILHSCIFFRFTFRNICIHQQYIPCTSYHFPFSYPTSILNSSVLMISTIVYLNSICPTLVLNCSHNCIHVWKHYWLHNYSREQSHLETSRLRYPVFKIITITVDLKSFNPLYNKLVSPFMKLFIHYFIYDCLLSFTYIIYNVVYIFHHIILSKLRVLTISATDQVWPCVWLA